MKITKLYSAAVVVMAALTFASCSNKKFHINGNITEAKDSMLYLENISLDGPVAIDSVKLGEDGSFAFEETAKTQYVLTSIACALPDRPSTSPSTPQKPSA